MGDRRGDGYLLSTWPKSTGFWLGGTFWLWMSAYGRSASGQLLKAQRLHVSVFIVKACRRLEGHYENIPTQTRAGFQ